MRLISLYIAGRILLPFCGILFLFLLALSLERSLRLVEEVTESNAALLEVLHLLLFLFPHYLGLALPAALFIGIMLGLRNLQDQSERVILHATGQSLDTIWKPVLWLSIITALCLFFVVNYAQPHARHAYRVHLNDLKQTSFTIPARAKAFHRINDETVIRAEQSDPDQNLMLGFFAFTQNQSGQKTIIHARQAKLDITDRQGPSLLLNDGQLITKRPGEKASNVAFDQYPWKPDMNMQSYGPRGQDERELTISELYQGGIQGLTTASPNEIQSELHTRLAHILSLPFLCLLAIPLAFWGQGRTGKAYGIAIGVVALVGYEKLLGFGDSFVASGSLPTWAGLWVPVLCLCLGSIFFLRQEVRRM